MQLSLRTEEARPPKTSGSTQPSHSENAEDQLCGKKGEWEWNRRRSVGREKCAQAVRFPFRFVRSPRVFAILFVSLRYRVSSAGGTGGIGRQKMDATGRRKKSDGRRKGTGKSI